MMIPDHSHPVFDVVHSLATVQFDARLVKRRITHEDEASIDCRNHVLKWTSRLPSQVIGRYDRQDVAQVCPNTSWPFAKNVCSGVETAHMQEDLKD
jgi:hypothetical protein